MFVNLNDKNFKILHDRVREKAFFDPPHVYSLGQPIAIPTSRSPRSHSQPSKDVKRTGDFSLSSSLKHSSTFEFAPSNGRSTVAREPLSAHEVHHLFQLASFRFLGRPALLAHLHRGLPLIVVDALLAHRTGLALWNGEGTIESFISSCKYTYARKCACGRGSRKREFLESISRQVVFLTSIQASRINQSKIKQILQNKMLYLVF